MRPAINWTPIDPLLEHHSNHDISRLYGMTPGTINRRRRELGIARSISESPYNRLAAYRIATYPRPAGLGEFLAELRNA